MGKSICFVTAEMAPLAMAGGLADVAGALRKYLHAAGHDIRLFLPFHACIDRATLRFDAARQWRDLSVKIGDETVPFAILEAHTADCPAPLYLVDCPEYFARERIYGDAPDEHRRFLLLTHAAFMGCQLLQFAPDILHCHDWHTAVGPLWLRKLYGWDQLFAKTRSVLTIHNIGYQGVFNASVAADLLPKSEWHALNQQDLLAGQVNLMRLGLIYADTVTTVSPTYAKEILLPEYGAGLQATLHQRDNVVGILNGVDYDVWDPRHDRHLPLHYGANRLGTKAKLKAQFFEELGLAGEERTPLVGLIARLVEQKGIGLLRAALPPLLKTRDFRLVVLGDGDESNAAIITELAAAFPLLVRFKRGRDEAMAHWIEAASDIFLMPSKYEPCGLNQMYSMRYGTIPVVRRTGGLADSVQHYDPIADTGTGIVFNDFDSPAVHWALSAALDAYRDKSAWRRLVQRAMAQDFSWQRQVGEYIRLYEHMATPPA